MVPPVGMFLLFTNIEPYNSGIGTKSSKVNTQIEKKNYTQCQCHAEYAVYLHGLPMNVYCLIGVK